MAKTFIQDFGDWIHEEDNEDRYGMSVSGTYWYCEVCDEAHAMPEAIEHSKSCSIGKAVALRARVETAEAEIKQLREAATYAVDMMNAFPACPVCGFTSNDRSGQRHSNDCPAAVLSKALVIQNNL